MKFNIESHATSIVDDIYSTEVMQNVTSAQSVFQTENQYNQRKDTMWKITGRIILYRIIILDPKQ